MCERQSLKKFIYTENHPTDNMEEAYLNINGIPTHIMTWGKWVQESLNDTDELIICVTGNPGTPGYYIDFLTKLYYDLKCKTPIWLIGECYICDTYRFLNTERKCDFLFYVISENV